MAEVKTRVRVNDADFFKVNEEVANDPEIQAGGHTVEVSRRLGMTVQSVTQRRNTFNRTFRDSGLTLTPFPKGGGGRKKDVEAIAEKLLAMRAEMQEAQQEEAVE